MYPTSDVFDDPQEPTFEFPHGDDVELFVNDLDGIEPVMHRNE